MAYVNVTVATPGGKKYSAKVDPDGTDQEILEDLLADETIKLKPGFYTIGAKTKGSVHLQNGSVITISPAKFGHLREYSTVVEVK